MKKRIVASLLTCSMLCCLSMTAFAEEDTTNRTKVSLDLEASDDSNQTFSEESTKTSVTFRNIPWWSTKAETEKQLIDEGAEILNSSFTNDILRMSGIHFANVTSGNDRVDGGGIVARYSGIKVAGYTPSETKACYIYTLNDDGTINKDENTAQFYFGWYTFDTPEYIDGEGVYNDLASKLQSLYGEGITNAESDYYTTIIWTDSTNNQIQLLLGGKQSDYKYVTLGYMASGADEKLNEMQVAIDEEAIRMEAIEREKNKTDVSGL